MRKEVCVAYLEKLLCEIAGGRSMESQENPAISFTQNVKSGMYDEMDDDTYNMLLDEVERLSRLWLDKAKQSSADLLCTALEDIGPNEAVIHRMAELLAEGCCKPAAGDETSGEDDLCDDLEDEWDDSFDDVWGDGRGTPEKQQRPETQKKEERRLPPVTFCQSIRAGKAELNTPSQIYEYVKARIYGQEDAVKAASFILYNHVRGRKRNVLFMGPTGCGKTEIWRVCKQIYPHIHIVNGATITADGWSGSNKLIDMFSGLDRDTAEQSIFVIDEFDKLCEPKSSTKVDNYSFMVQSELLKLIEGEELTIKNPDSKGSEGKKMVIDTSKISFVFCGSFEQLTQVKTKKLEKKAMGFGQKLEGANADDVYETEIHPDDLVLYAGLRREIAGRINRIVQLRPMTAQDYQMILKDELMSPLFQLEKLYGVRLTVDEETEQDLCRKADETHMGVRYLRGALEKMLDDQMFDDCTKKEYALKA